MTDIVITWPKTKELADYLWDCETARLQHAVINYRVTRAPRGPIDRVYVVHSGYVRGWQKYIGTVHRGPREVRDPITGEFWPQGTYIVRDPIFYTVVPTAMPGFRGWRYFDRNGAA